MLKPSATIVIAIRQLTHLPFLQHDWAPRWLGVTWTETFNCDICGKQKGSVDHWWLAWTETYRPHPDASERGMLKIYPWENMSAHDAAAKHLCGQACLQKLVDRWMSTEMAAGAHAESRRTGSNNR